MFGLGLTHTSIAYTTNNDTVFFVCYGSINLKAIIHVHVHYLLSTFFFHPSPLIKGNECLEFVFFLYC